MVGEKIILNLLLGVCLFFLLTVGCEKSTKQETLEQSTRIEENQKALSDSTLAAVDYGEIMNRLYTLEQQIRTNPDDLTTRRDFMNTAFDSARKKLYTVGEGLPDTSAVSEAAASQGAERAAVIDAQRWALLALTWKKDFQTQAFPHKISGSVPPFQLVQKAQLPENKIYVLIEIGM